MISGTSIVSSQTHLHFVDTGAPSQPEYTTIFAIHGMCFGSPIFEKLQSTAFSRGIRAVAVTRRNFPGSTPFTTDEAAVVTGTDASAKQAWLDDRGREIAVFISDFIKSHDLPTLSADGSKGGVAILAWSLGTPFAVAAVASAASLPTETRDRFASNLRTLIMHEPSPIALGMPAPPKNWTPLGEQSIPQEHRFLAFAQWITSYFDHGDLGSRDLDVLSYWIPSSSRAPTVFNIPPAFLDAHLRLDADAFFDMYFIRGMQEQMKASHRAAFFDDATRKLFGRMKVWLLTGDRAPAWGPAGMWALQDEEKELKKEGSIVFKVIPGGNHFMHWDEPEGMLDACQEAMAL